MDVTIFKEITTEGVIASIEENSKKYHDGLYADMNNLPERIMVKKGAAEIGDIIKALKTSRIAITKANTAAVNKEHDAIVERLTVANKPFTDLLDAYNAERKVVLDAEKARKQAVLDAEKFELDHEMGLLINKTFEFDRAQELKAKQEHDDAIRKQADIDAEERAKSKSAHAEAVKLNEENARLANVEHVRTMNRNALADLIELGLTEGNAMVVVKAIAKKLISNVTINY